MAAGQSERRAELCACFRCCYTPKSRRYQSLNQMDEKNRSIFDSHSNQDGGQPLLRQILEQNETEEGTEDAVVHEGYEDEVLKHRYSSCRLCVIRAAKVNDDEKKANVNLKKKKSVRF